MLVLQRKKGESIQIAENIEISVLNVNGKRVRIGIRAPAEISVIRAEIVSPTQSNSSDNLKTESDDHASGS